MDIILASTSPHRRRLLERLQIGFRCMPPQTDETPLEGEAAAAVAQRLARAKAESIAIAHPASIVIGSDQVAELDGRLIGKPGSHRAAVAQLQASSGREVQFHTGVAVRCLEGGIDRFHVEPFSARFRALTDAQIEAYLQREQPYDCAGSFKMEGLGIVLFASLRGEDPTSLEGLPLIALTQLLSEAGIRLLAT